MAAVSAEERRRRSAAARKAAATRKRGQAIRAALTEGGAPLMTPAERDALRGSQADRVLSPAASKAIIAGALANLKAREA